MMQFNVLVSSSVARCVHLGWLFLGAAIAGVSALSGCQECEQTGDCSRAYRGAPGQFCGHWLDRATQRQSCCCPNGAVCRVSNYACNCAYAGRDRAPRYYDDDPLLWLWWLLGTLAFVLCCGGCLWMLFVRSRRNGFDDGEVASPIPMAYPVYDQPPTAPNYGTAAPLYTAPAYSAPPYASGGDGYGNRQGMGAGTGAALGGAAGFLGGMLVGDALADAGDRGGGGYDGGGYDGGGDDGGDGGDFGGDF